MDRKIPKIPLFFLALTLGYAAWVLPATIIPGTEEVEIPFGISTLTDIARSRNYSILSLFISGVILGFLDPRGGPLWAMATMLLVLVFATIEGLFGFSAHNLFGIEIIMYGIFTIPAVFGAFLVKILVRLKRARAS